jgi:hypothetical protein
VSPARGSAAALTTSTWWGRTARGVARNGGELCPAGLFRMTHDPLPSRRPAPFGSRANHTTGYVSAGPPIAARTFEQERLAAVDRERLDLDQRLVAGCRRPGYLDEFHQRI